MKRIMVKQKIGKFRLKKGDLVEVISGEEKGSQGKIIEIMKKTGRVVVEGVNIVKRHTRPTSATNPGGIVEKPGSIHYSNLRLICPRCAQRTKATFHVIEGKRHRICKKCGEVID